MKYYKDYYYKYKDKAKKRCKELIRQTRKRWVIIKVDQHFSYRVTKDEGYNLPFIDWTIINQKQKIRAYDDHNFGKKKVIRYNSV